MKDWESAYVAGIIDGEGSITLTRMQLNEHRRPCISIPSTDLELLLFVQTLTGGTINKKTNYNPEKHKNSFTLTIKNKSNIFYTLNHIIPYLRISQKRNRGQWILEHYDEVTPRNGKYTTVSLQNKINFEQAFFEF